MSKSIVHGSLIIFSGLILGKILAMANGIILARYLNAEKYGLFLLGLSIFGFLQIPAKHGAPSILPKFIAGYRVNNQFDTICDIISLTIGQCFFVAILLSLVTFFSAPYISEHIFNDPGLKNILKTLSFILPMAAITPVILSIFRGYKITRAKVIYENILQYLLRIPLFLIFFYAGFELSAAYFSFAITTVLLSVFISVDMIKTLKIDFKISLYDHEISPTLFKQSWPLMMQSLVWIIYTRIDRLFIGYYLESREVGVYGAAGAIAGLLTLIPQSFSFLALPMFSKFMANESLLVLRVVYKKITALMFALSFPIFICLVFLSKDILIMLYGNEYSSGATALLIISGGILSRCLIGPATEALIGAGKTKAPLISLSLGCTSNILLNVLLIPSYGINGAAIATCISMYVARLTIAWFNHKYLKIIPISGSQFVFTSIFLLLVPVFIILKKMQLPLVHPSIIVPLTGILYLATNYMILLCILRLTSFGKRLTYELTNRGSA
jgi:O-antigen/teichoic acid export membrane protein